MAEPIEPSPALEVVRAVDERADSFNALMARQLDPSYGLATVILGNRGDAEDAVHDAAVSAWRGLPRLREPEHLDAWFRRIVVNACRDRLRRRTRERTRFATREALDSEHPVDEGTAERMPDRLLVERALGRLDADAQVMVALRYEVDLTVPQIAVVLGLRAGTVKSRLHAALGRLREQIEAEA